MLYTGLINIIGLPHNAMHSPSSYIAVGVYRISLLLLESKAKPRTSVNNKDILQLLSPKASVKLNKVLS